LAKEMFKELIELAKANKGRVFGGVVGFIIAILVLTIGFFKTLFIVLCTSLGIFLGNDYNRKVRLRELIDKIFDSTNRN